MHSLIGKGRLASNRCQARPEDERTSALGKRELAQYRQSKQSPQRL